jgi:4-amino-4-deoxy-L-arabinose transferase-like glycosyltransferase
MNRYLPPILTGLLFALGIVIASFHLNDPLITDETQFATSAKTILQGSFPKAYFGDTLSPYLSHPPTYSYLLALFIWLGDWGGRALGLALMAINALLVYLLLPKLWLRADGWGRLLAVAIVLLCPLTMPASLLLDIDGGLLTLAILLMALAGARYLEHPTGNRWMLLALACGGASLVKLTTPLAFLPALLVYALVVRKSPWLKTVLAFLAGAAGALLLLGLYYLIWGVSPLGPLNIIGWKLGSGGGVGLLSSLGEYFNRQMKIIYWLSPFLCILLLVGWIYTFTKGYRRGLFPATMGWMILVGYLLVGGDAYGLCKYQQTAVPMLALAVAIPVREQVGALSLSRKLVFAGVGLLLVPAFYFLVGDMLHLPFTRTELINLGELTRQAANRELIFQTLATLIAFGFLLVIWSFKRDRLIIVPLAMFISMGLVQQWEMGRADYSIGYNYGEEGMMTAVLTAEHYLPPDGLLICPSDIAYYVGYDHPYVEITQAMGRGELAELLTSAPPKVLVIRASYLGHTEFANELGKAHDILSDYARVRVGYFIVYFPGTSSSQ